MANSIDFNGIVKSKYTFYIMLLLSATNLFGYISKKKYNSILIFVLSGFLLKNIYKNTNIVLILALIISTFYTMFYYKKEGLIDHHPVNNIYHNTATVSTTTSEDSDSDTDTDTDDDNDEETEVEVEVFLNINEFIYLLYDIDPPIWTLDDAGLVTNANNWGDELFYQHDTTGNGGLNATELKTALDSIGFEITEEYANELVTEYRGSYTNEVLATSPVFENQRAEAAENTTTETTDETTDEDTYVSMNLFCTNFIDYQKRIISGTSDWSDQARIASWYNQDDQQDGGKSDEENIIACKNNIAADNLLTGNPAYVPATWDACATDSDTYVDYMHCNGKAHYI